MVEVGERRGDLKEQVRECLSGYLDLLGEGIADQISGSQILDEAGVPEEVDKESRDELLAGVIKEKLRIDPLALQGKDLVRRDIVVEGVLGQPSEGGGVANVYKTRKRGIFLRVVDYRNPELGRQYDLVADPDLEI